MSYTCRNQKWTDFTYYPGLRVQKNDFFAIFLSLTLYYIYLYLFVCIVATLLFSYILSLQSVKGKATSRYLWLTPQFYYDLLQTLLSRVYNSLEWGLNSPPKPHAFTSLPLQSRFSLSMLKANIKEKFNLKNIVIAFFSISVAWYLKNRLVNSCDLDLNKYIEFLLAGEFAVSIRWLIHALLRTLYEGGNKDYAYTPGSEAIEGIVNTKCIPNIFTMQKGNSGVSDGGAGTDQQSESSAENNVNMPPIEPIAHYDSPAPDSPRSSKSLGKRPSSANISISDSISNDGSNISTLSEPTIDKHVKEILKKVLEVTQPNSNKSQINAANLQLNGLDLDSKKRLLRGNMENAKNLRAETSVHPATRAFIKGQTAERVHVHTSDANSSSSNLKFESKPSSANSLDVGSFGATSNVGHSRSNSNLSSDKKSSDMESIQEENGGR